ncbi:hypothetical protein BDQ17DRAFT_1434497 [Cyathus striatus]|nr:hypothetical protein BDQ17DRAFT_1434497 [Cyathus striatus]
MPALICYCSKCHPQGKKMQPRTAQKHIAEDQKQLTEIMNQPSDVQNRDIISFYEDCIRQTQINIQLANNKEEHLDIPIDIPQENSFSESNLPDSTDNVFKSTEETESIRKVEHDTEELQEQFINLCQPELSNEEEIILWPDSYLENEDTDSDDEDELQDDISVMRLQSVLEADTSGNYYS